MIKLIVDSTCDLDETFIKEYKIDVIPLQVLINGISYKDKLEIELETLYEHIRQGDDVKTSLPSYDDMFPLFENYAKTNQPFIFFSFAKALSGTYNFASILVEELKTKYDTPMAVIDLKNGGLGSTLLIEEIVRFTQKNYNFDDVVNFSENLTHHMKHLIMLEDVSQLRKGGRISAIASALSTALTIRPVLELVQGAIKSYKRAIGSKRALKELVNYVEKHHLAKDHTIGILKTANDDLFNNLHDSLKKLGYTNIRVGTIASVMTAHIGLDAVSICFLT